MCWAAIGMLRVYATLKYSECANGFKNELKTLCQPQVTGLT